MKMTRDGSEQTHTDETTDAGECGPGCDCHTPGLSAKGKAWVCLVVGLAAAVVLARGAMKKAAAANDGHQQSFATALPVVQAERATPDNKVAAGAEKGEAQSALWGDPLDSLASLNRVASEKDAVFVLLTAGSDEEIEAIKDRIEAAAKKIISRGTTMAAFTLNRNAQDYAQITGQTPAPCVLTMVKGRGLSVVAEDITEANLLQALVAASRPSNCGTSDCGPAACP